MDSPLFLAILLLFLFCLSALFSATETAYVSINKIRLQHLREKKVKGAELVWKLTTQTDRVLTTILVCNNLVNTAAAAIGAVVCVNFFGPELGVLISTVGTTLVLLIFCETTPKIFSTHHTEFMTFSVRHLVQGLIWVFKPVVEISNRISFRILKLFGIRPRRRSSLVSEEEMKLMIRVGKDEGFYGDEERKMLERIFHFDEIDVFEVMTPVDKMVSIDVNFDEDVLADILMEEGHNRIPVYENDPQNIIGILYVHDLLYLMRNNKLIRVQDLLSAPYFVSPDKKVSVLLKEFQAKKIQIAMVRSKSGKILGLVTLEDLIEEIVGEIEEYTPV